MNVILRYIVCVLIFVLTITGNVLAQTKTIDSLLKVYDKLNSQTDINKCSLKDTTMVGTMIQLGKRYRNNNDIDKAMYYVTRAKTFSMKLLPLAGGKAIYVVKRGLATSLIGMGLILDKDEHPDVAKEKFLAALIIAKEIGEEKMAANVYVQLGLVERNLGNYGSSIHYSLLGLKIYESTNDLKGISIIYANMAVTYKNQKKYEEALECNLKSLKIREDMLLKDPKDMDSKKTVGTIHLNIGVVYKEKNDLVKSLQEYEKALEIYKQLNSKRDIVTTLNNMAVVYFRQGDYDKAREIHLENLKLSEELKNKKGIAMACLNLANMYVERMKMSPGFIKKDGPAAHAYLQRGMALLEEIKAMEYMPISYYSAYNLDSLTGNKKGAFENYKLFIQSRDSLIGAENTKKSIQAEMNYQFEKKEQATKLKQEKKDALELEENKKQKLIRNSFVIGFAIMMLLAVFIFRSYRQKQKSSKVILTQKLEVEKQKTLVEQKQMQIMDSINYAKRIQESILSPEEEIKKQFQELFILYIPKDIVSGDFYWFTKIGNKEMLLVAADCTGHGVPGAFLSMVGSTLLNEIVIHKGITDPANIITELAIGVSSTLVNTEKEESNTDGMDISVCKINVKEGKVNFGGANHTLYIANNSGLKKIESQISSINGIFGLAEDEKINSIEVNPEKGSMVYMATDGYADQIGEKSLKKFLTSRFETVLKDIYSLTPEEQKIELTKTLVEWKGGMNQVDDVLVIGFRM